MQNVSEKLKPGSRLLSVVKLAQDFGDCQVTAHKSRVKLKDEGLVVGSPCRGTSSAGTGAECEE